MKKEKREFSLLAGRPLKEGLLRIIDGLVQEAIDRIRQSGCEKSDDIHFVRVTIKRLRAILHLYQPVIGVKAYTHNNARLGKAAHKLSSARDADVVEETLGTLINSDHMKKGSNGRIHFIGINNRSNIDIDIGAVTDALESTVRSLHRARISGTGWEAIEPGLTNVYRRSCQRMKKACTSGRDEAFHQWRISAKQLYYGLELLEPIAGTHIRRTITSLTKLQKKIGDEHDLMVLKETILANRDAFGTSKAVKKILELIKRRSKKLRRAAISLGKTVLCEEPWHFVQQVRLQWDEWSRHTPDLRVTSVKKLDRVSIFDGQSYSPTPA
jgi:CHAD domain-containing protein